MNLHDAEEVLLFGEFSQKLATHRFRPSKDAPDAAAMECGRIVRGGAGDPPSSAPLFFDVGPSTTAISSPPDKNCWTLGDGTCVGQGCMHDPPVAVPVLPSTSELEAALRTYLNTHGFPAAQALLQEFGAARFGDVPAERTAEFYARMTK